MENGHPRVAIFYLFHGGEKRAPCGARAVAKAAGSKPCAYLRKGGPRNVGESLFAPPLTEWNSATLGWPFFICFMAESESPQLF